MPKYYEIIRRFGLAIDGERLQDVFTALMYTLLSYWIDVGLTKEDLLKQIALMHDSMKENTQEKMSLVYSNTSNVKEPKNSN